MKELEMRNKKKRQTDRERKGQLKGAGYEAKGIKCVYMCKWTWNQVKSSAY